MSLDLLRPAWFAPANVGAAMSTRHGGVSSPPFDSLNLARPSAFSGSAVAATGDAAATAAAAIAENRRRFAAALAAAPVYLEQVHGADVLSLAGAGADIASGTLCGDAAVTTVPGVACTVLVADCLPVLFCTENGIAVAAAHAGWRGLAAGVLDNTVAALCLAANCEPRSVLAWLGPCIGQRRFEVGADVHAAFAGGETRFVWCPRADGSAHWLADLSGLALDRLNRIGVCQVSSDGSCTAEDQPRFFSYRRDRITGRMAASVWLVQRALCSTGNDFGGTRKTV